MQHKYLRWWRMTDELVGPLNKVLHVRRIGVATVVLSPGKLPVQQSLIHCRHLCRMVVVDIEPLCPKQFVAAARVDGSHEAPLMIKPVRIAFLRYAVADEGKPR